MCLRPPNGRFRAETGFGYQVNDIDCLSIDFLNLSLSINAAGDVTTLSFMANGYYDITVGDAKLKAYIGAGIGFADVVTDITILGLTGTYDDTALAYQFSAGLRYKLTEDIDLRAGYRMFATAERDFDGTVADYRSQNLLVGVTFY